MIKKLIPAIVFIMLAMLLALSSIPAAASSQPQAFYQTPTPDGNGRIVYFVQAGETCISISLKTGATLDEIRLLNNLSGDCVLSEGQELLLAVVEAVPPTPGPSPTPGEPTPTPFAGSAQVCVYLFEDVNGNAMAEETEIALPSGAISIADRIGQYSKTQDFTGGPDPVCFDQVPEGDYNISAAIPEEFTATMVLNYALVVNAGDTILLDFGAQRKAQAQANEPGSNTESSGGSTLLMAIVGGGMVLAGIGLGIYVWALGRRPRGMRY